jgi:hypothetical protein
MCEASRVRVQHPVAWPSTPSVAGHQTTVRTSWRGPIGTPQFFHSVQQPRTDDNARRDVQNTKNLALAPPIFSICPRQVPATLFICEQYATPTRSVPEMERPSASGYARPPLAQPHDGRGARNGPRDSIGARQKNARPPMSGPAMHIGNWPHAQTARYVRWPLVGRRGEFLPCSRRLGYGADFLGVPRGARPGASAMRVPSMTASRNATHSWPRGGRD